MKTIPFGKVARFLEGEIIPQDRPTEERQLIEALATDAIWGSMREEKYRGVPEGYGQMETARKRALARLTKLPEEAPIIRNETPLFDRWGVGWGSYHWRYNPEIPKLAMEWGAIMIDTAETYGFGRVEKQLGAALRGLTPFVATKVSRAHMSPAAVVRAFQRSTEALGRVPDLYQTHWPSASIPISETLGALMVGVPELKAVGLSNVSIDQIYAAQMTCPTITSVQVKLFVEASVWAKALVPFCRASGLTLIAHSPFGQGHSIDRKALIFCRDHGVIPIPGTNNPLHLQENLRWS